MKKWFVILAAAVMAGCDGVFDVHPYDVHFDGDRDINARGIEEIESMCRDKDTLRVAFISDTHCEYTEASEMIADINRRDSVDFVVHLGDLTNTGTTKEFVWCRDMMSKLEKPYVALIGNHDFLGTGDEVYVAMFGKMDFSFIAGRVKFVCLNTNATEYDYVAAVPNLDYMEEQMTEDSLLFDRTIICMHAAPFSDQFNNNVAKAFEHYVNLFPGLHFCIFGHDHYQKVLEPYDDGVIYYGVGSAEHRKYMLFTITTEGYEYEVITI